MVRLPPLRRSAAMLAIAVAALAPAAEAQWLAVNWSSCALPAETPVQSFACDTDEGTPIDLVVSLSPFTWMGEVTGADAGVWFRSTATTLPSWWQLQEGGCRTSAFSLAPEAPFPDDCWDPWLGAATVTASVEARDCDPNTLVFHVRAELPAGTTRTLVPGRRYAMFRIRITREGTTGSTACEGCSLGGCFGVESIYVSNSAGLGWSSSPGTLAGWQSTTSCIGGPTCVDVPVRGTTWGAVKALYR